LRQQITALVDAGVDVVVLETFGFLDELLEAVRTAAEVADVPILAQTTFTAEGHMLSGETPQQVAGALAGLPIAGLGANCTVGPQRMLEIVEQLCRHSELPISAQPNAGLPRRAAGGRFEYSIDGDYFARYAGRCVAAGAAIVGGCCGTGPAHLAAVVSALSSPSARTPARAPTPPALLDPFAKKLTEHRFVLAAEIASPSGGSVDTAAELAAALRPHTDVVVVSAMSGHRAQVSSTSLALHLRNAAGIEPIATFTTWDKTIMSLQADLLGAHAFGIRTIVCETGNPPLRGDYPNADGIWEVDSIGLIGLVAGLNAARDCNGLPLATTTSFCIGARFNPGNDDLDAEIVRTRAKVAAGASFLITRPVYGVDAAFRRLLAEVEDLRVPVFATVSPLSGFAEAEYLANEVPDVAVPEEVLAELDRAGTGDHARSIGFEVAADLLSQLRGLCQGAVVVARHDDHTTAQRLLSAVAV
jgi:homocysteine S-methyltransferase